MSGKTWTQLWVFVTEFIPPALDPPQLQGLTEGTQHQIQIQAVSLFLIQLLIWIKDSWISIRILIQYSRVKACIQDCPKSLRRSFFQRVHPKSSVVGAFHKSVQRLWDALLQNWCNMSCQLPKKQTLQTQNQHVRTCPYPHLGHLGGCNVDGFVFVWFFGILWSKLSVVLLVLRECFPSKGNIWYVWSSSLVKFPCVLFMILIMSYLLDWLAIN